MKKTILIFVVCSLAAFAANAQTRKSEQAKAWKQFQTAVARSDKEAVAAMIERFPFEASIIGAISNFTVASKADFIKNYDRIFTAARRRKIARGKYEPIDGEDEFNFEMSETGGFQVFRFRKIGAAYRLVGTIAVG